MIATVVFFTEEGVFKGVLVSDVWVTAMHEGARQVFVRARAWLEDMEFMGGKWSGLQEGMEEAGLFGRIQGGCWGCWFLGPLSLGILLDAIPFACLVLSSCLAHGFEIDPLAQECYSWMAGHW